MALTQAWTGRTACVLQSAMRLSNEAFARHLGVAVRTVAKWHEKLDSTPRAEMQQLLDTAFERASESTRSRFSALLAEQAAAARGDGGEPASAYALTVAIAVVTNESQVLIVQRRGEDGKGISWQFPAGMVKPGISPETVAVRETFAETGVHCGVSRNLGGRLHPITNVYCEYLLCEYLGGDAENKNIAENVTVTWAAADKLTRFIPAEHVYPPILEALEVQGE